MAARKGFSSSLKSGAKKTNNHPAAAKAKAELRAFVFEEIGADKAAVFDAFAGAGAMHAQVWHQAAHYVGCDLVWYRDHRRAFVADNRRVLRCIDLRQFNIFDLDAYGSPWEQALIVADRRPLAPGEKIGVLLTEGSGLNMKLGGMAAGLRILAGMKPGVAGASRQQDSIIDRAIGGLCRRMHGRVVRRWQARGTTGSQMRYIGLIIEGNKDGQSIAAHSKLQNV